ncbi:MAG: C25 family cysteine peptidase, partial [Chloroflexia bacterium]
YHPYIRVEVTFSGEAGAVSSLAEPAPFEQLLSENLLNYAQARQWRANAVPPLDLPPLPPSPGYRVRVRRAGIYRLTYGDLQAAGLPVDTLDPRRLRLFRYGEEVAIQVSGEGDGRFDPSDTILFYGQPLSGTRYSDTEVYWLTYGGEMGLRISSRPAPPHGTAPIPSWFSTTERREENALYYPYAPWRPEHDHWFWNYLYPQAGVYYRDFPFPAHALSSEPYTTTLRFYVYSLTSVPSVAPDHHLRAFVNGVPVGEWWWDGKQEMTPTVYFPSSLLQPTGNTVRLACPGDTGAPVEFVAVDWVELGEHRLFAAEGGQIEWTGAAGNHEYHLSGFPAPDVLLWDITDPDRPTAIVSVTVVPGGGSYEVRFEDTVPQPTRYLASVLGKLLAPESIVPAEPVDLRDPSNGADYLVITHPAFATAAETLTTLRAAQGLRTRVVSVQAIYDAFSYGRAVADAIRDFLAYTYSTWSAPAPSYVVLFGDGHYDGKNYLGYGVGNFIPPYLAFVDPWIGEVAADNRYACVSGDDPLPDMYLGRLPANTPAEAQAMVDKVVLYETALPAGEWRSRSLFVADDADSAGNFDDLSDDLIAGYYPAPYQAERVYLGVTHPYERPSVVARNAIISAINEGRLLVNYIGHAATFLWASERLLDNPDLSDLHNGPYYPVAVPMTCYEGMYHDPRPDPAYHALAELFVRAAGKGWLASWSPTGPGVATGHHFLDEGFFHALFLDDEPRLGPATLSGKLRLYASGTSLELLDTFLLLGDPAVTVALLPSGLSLHKDVEPARPLHPGEPITYTLHLYNAGPATAHHVVLTDVLPAAVISPSVYAAGITLTPRVNSPLSWDVSDLVSGQSGVVTIAGTIAPATPPGFITNRVVVRSSNPSEDPADNADRVTSLIAAGLPSRIEATVLPPQLPADGRSLAVVLATVQDVSGLPVSDGTPVHFLTDAGTFDGGMQTFTGTTHLGIAEAILRAGTEMTTATVSLASGEAWYQLAVPFLPLPPDRVNVRVGPPVIGPTGTAAVTVTVTDRLGHPVQDGTPVQISTTLGAISPTVAPAIQGRAYATLQGTGETGWATIVASSGGASGHARVRVGEPLPLTLTLEIEPRTLLADGTSQVQVVATLRWASGQPFTETVWVHLATTLGEIPSRSLAVSGTTQVSLTAGLRTGMATVTAWGEGISAWSEVTFVPGAPAAISVTGVPQSIPVDGHRALARVAVTDGWGHPVADGTAVSLSASLGILTPTVASTWEGEVEGILTSGTQAGLSVILAASGIVSGNGRVSFLPLAPAAIALTAHPDVLVADGVSTATLRCRVVDPYANPVADGTRVEWGASLGHVWPEEGFTAGGWATATLQSERRLGTGLAWAVGGMVSATVAIQFVPGPPAAILVTASSTRLIADGVSTATLWATVWDCVGHRVADGTPVTFTTTLGDIEPNLGWTRNGVVTATLHSAREPGIARIRAAAGEVWHEIQVEFYRHTIYLPIVPSRRDGATSAPFP